MDYETFKARVKEHVKEKVEEGDKVTINHILKNNGMELDGLVIMERDSNMAPTIYINSYYDELRKGRSLDSIVDELFKIHRANKTGLKIDSELFNEYDNIKNSIVYKVINYEKNKKLLKGIPHKKILDLAVVYYCLIEQNEGNNATALIHNEHLATWKISQDIIHEDAVKNTPKILKSSLKPMSKILSDMTKDMDIPDEICDIKPERDMYVLTNRTRINGAACILYDSVLEKIADKLKADLYILPSSIHEVIILPKVNNYDKDILANMVREVNTDGVAMEEILSDNVYEYSRREKVLML